LERVSIDILGNVLAHVASANHHDPRIRKQSETASNVSDNNKSKLMKPRVIRSYVWDVGMGSWLRTSSEDFVQSTYYSTLASSNESVVQGSNIMEHAMQKLQQTTARLQVQEEQRTRHQRHTPLFSLNALVNEAPEWAMLDTIAHLQHQLTVAVSLRDAVSFKAWLGTYVRFLSRHDELALLKDVCDDVLMGVDVMISGSLSSTVSAPGCRNHHNNNSNDDKYLPVNKTFLGLQRKALLLETILPAMRAGDLTVRRAQFVAEYLDMFQT
jgi:hypothetical protein